MSFWGVCGDACDGAPLGFWGVCGDAFDQSQSRLKGENLELLPPGEFGAPMDSKKALDDRTPGLRNALETPPVHDQSASVGEWPLFGPKNWRILAPCGDSDEVQYKGG